MVTNIGGISYSLNMDLNSVPHPYFSMYNNCIFNQENTGIQNKFIKYLDKLLCKILQQKFILLEYLYK